MPFNEVDPETGKIEYGLVIKDEEQILRNLNKDLIKNLQELTQSDVVIDTSEQSPIGRLNAVFARRLSSIWGVAKDVEDSMYVSSSSGISLSKLALLVGFLRKPDTASVGDLRFVGEDKTRIPSESEFSSLQGEIFTNPQTFDISLLNCYSFRVSSAAVYNNRDYSITIDEKEYLITSALTGDSNLDILSSLKLELDKETTVTSQIIQEDVNGDTIDFLEVVKIVQADTMNVRVSALLKSSKVTVEAPVRSVNKGFIFGDALTIVNIETPITGLEEVYNLNDFLLGDDVETDEELRVRISTDYNSVGSGTYDAIEDRLLNNEGVSSVFIDENRGFEVSPEGVPAKSYECIVAHNTDDQEIAQLIWDVKPAGIETHGQLTLQVKDSSAVEQDVSYTLAEALYANIRVKYSINTDGGEIFPAVGGDRAISEAVSKEGATYKINQDVIGKRFYAPIYENVEGVGDLEISVHLSPTIVEDPTTIQESDWIPREAVGRTQIATFAPSRNLIEPL